MSALDRIVAATREEVSRRRREVPAARLESLAAARISAGDVRAFGAALSEPGVSVIAEHKRRSPSAGVIRSELALEEVVSAYERGGARALSILTEGPNFGGSLDDLAAARRASTLPLLRKDFTVDSYQLLESVAGGADAILLIVAALTDDQLHGLHVQALALGLAALVEVHDERELDRALALGAEVIGINNRDLRTLTVDKKRTFELLPRASPHATIVAESGFSRPDDLARLADAGADAVLIGEALMRAQDIEAACRVLTTSGGPI